MHWREEKDLKDGTITGQVFNKYFPIQMLSETHFHAVIFGANISSFPMFFFSVPSPSDPNTISKPICVQFLDALPSFCLWLPVPVTKSHFPEKIWGKSQYHFNASRPPLNRVHLHAFACLLGQRIAQVSAVKTTKIT